jgi:flagellar hook-length control protein FliK
VIASSSLRTGLAERVHPPVTGEKVALLSSTFATTVAGTAPILPGFDTGEGISSTARQTELLAQVIEAAQPLVQHGGGRVLISLNPPSLGALDIDVRVKRDTVELFVIANNQDVQQTLCSHVEQLRKALVDQGLNMDRFQVVVGDRSGGQLGRDPRQEGMSGWQGESRSDRGYHPETDGENASEEIGGAVRPDMYPSIEGINVFI